MNASNSKSLRFTCRAVRAWIALGGEATAGGGPGSRHVENCADCRHFFAAARALEASLRRAAAGRDQGVPPGLEEGIVRAVSQSALSSRRPARPVAWLALAGVAASLALAIYLVPRPAAPPQVREATPRPAPEVASIPTPQLPAAEEILPHRILNSLVAESDFLVEKNPVQDEVDSVSADTRSALHFLSVNFLPDSPKKAADEAADEPDPGV